ncbi:copper resistance D family protein [Cytobacillus sp. FJAT-54145]|uniref:Copper resistance D family protein n=1 Tax=Cytobacillus spartinae TaxID=3299023 RepID=A0ABW6K6X1_9BACI
MMILTIFSETLLYLCFSILIGAFLLSLITNSHKPDIKVPKGVMMASIGGIAIFSFVPLLSLIFHLYEDLGFLTTFHSVLFTFEVGKAWIFTYIVANFLFIFVVWIDYRKNPFYAMIGLSITLLLLLALGWASHASSLDQWKGFLTHTAHFTAVCVWVGVLIVTSWFSINHSNWSSFLRWFRPLAMICFTATVLSGLVLMSLVVEFKEYPTSWSISYGQALLIKHLLVIPLIAYAFINSFLIRKRLQLDSTYNPIIWTRAESIVVLLIFSVTAALGQQSPPHDIALTIRTEGVSSLFSSIYRGNIYPDFIVQFSLNVMSLSFFALSFVFLALIILSYVKKLSVIVSFYMCFLFVVSGYLALILSLQ